MKKKLWTLLFTFLAVIWGGTWLIDALAGKNEETSKELLYSMLEDSVSAHYALYGQYPHSLEALCEKYHIYIDSSKYIVRYDVFADNIRPIIEIIEIGTRHV